jgi:hypothetical protein
MTVRQPAGSALVVSREPDWRDGVVYQIYPRSFADHDGNGVGDLRGILDHLDHFGPTGSTSTRSGCLDLPSPGRDLGTTSATTGGRPAVRPEAGFDNLAACPPAG